MPTRLARRVFTPSSRYVCSTCRLQSSPLVGGQPSRNQHTGPSTHADGDEGHGSFPKDFGNNNDLMSRSSMGEVVRDFISEPKGYDKKPKADSRNKSHEQSPSVPSGIPSIITQSKDSPDVSQQKLQEKFSAQRRREMHAMQADQGSKAVEATQNLPKARSVPEPTERNRERLSTRIKKPGTKRRLEGLALAENVVQRFRRIRSMPIHSAQKQPQAAKYSPLRSKASTRKTRETPGAESKDTNDDISVGNISRKRGPVGQKKNSVMAILESSKSNKKLKKLKKPVASEEKAREMEVESKDTELKRVVAAVLLELQNRGESLETDPRKIDTAIMQTSSQLLERFKTSSKEIPQSPEQPKVGMLKRASKKRSLQVRRTRSLYIRRLQTDRRTTPRKVAHNVLSPRDTLGHKSRSDKGAEPRTLKSAKREDVEQARALKIHLRRAQNPQDSPTSLKSAKSENIKKARAPKLPRKRAQNPQDSPTSLKSAKSENIEKARAPKPPRKRAQNPKDSPTSPIETASASDLEILPVKVDQPPVPRLAYGLERVLFNPGVYQLQDPRSRVYNFDPYLQKIMPIAEFDFNALKEYITSSRDDSLLKIAKEQGKRYIGSTSSMTEVLSHFHFLLSQWRSINSSMLSKAFPVSLTNFTEHSRIPSAIFLRWKDGSYAIDADKEFGNASILSMLGKSMEKLLTLSTDDFERYRKSSPGIVTEDERFAPESYHYSTLGDFLMRSQLDAHDPRLPGTGMFDLKTRSVVSIRMDVANYGHGIGYEIKSRQGEWESYEREYHDMIRAAFLKYSMQVRMGRMDGIFVAFHNIERIFGFQYISLSEMDCTIHGQQDPSLGDQEFRLSLDLMNKVLDRATRKYPETSLRIFFETRETQTPFMYVFAEPVTEEQVADIQSRNKSKIEEFERKVLGLTRGNGSETSHAQEASSDWEEIRADVQKAMEKDELVTDESGHNQEAIDDEAKESEVIPKQQEVFEEGPLYASKNAAHADNNATAVSADSQENEDDGEDEDDDDVDGEDEDEEDKEDVEDEDEIEVEEQEEQEDCNTLENGEVKESSRLEGLEEFLDGKADVSAMDAVEAEGAVVEDGKDENSVGLTEKCPVESQSNANPEGNYADEDDMPGTTSGQESVDKDQHIKVSHDAKSNRIAEGEAESQQENQDNADQCFLDSIDQGPDQADSTGTPSPSKDILAMTLTLRNKVNGEYVVRPDEMTAADEWSIEYSLAEVSTQERARAFYMACQRRRRNKMEAPLVREDARFVNQYVQNLRDLSKRGRKWRERQDKMDGERPVQVLSGVNHEEVEG